MSTSRLEKFIYAICSMDVTDLPTPLSRIEKLWNCLITGETPDFEPLSRNEKYLMAMLDRYDISNLPAPMSRGEKLLYKIAVGETDLSDVPEYLSRYEELLKYLIENGGISGGDFEYVLYTINKSLYTLYETAEKPVKSAILSGCTLVSLGNDKIDKSFTYDVTVNILSDVKNLKPNTNYIILMGHSASSDRNVLLHMYRNDWSYIGNQSHIISPTKKYIKFTSPNDVVCNFQIQNISQETFTGYDLMLLEYQDGMENWDIPYFTGMSSVKMPVLRTTGKNLFDITKHNLSKDSEGDYICTNYYGSATPVKYNLKPNTKYRVNNLEGTGHYNLSVNDVWVNTNALGSVTFTTDNSGEYYIRVGSDTYDNRSKKFATHLQIEEGSTITPYEPHKSNILTVNEDVELRGIGDVKDELDLTTRELTAHVGFYEFNGTERFEFVEKHNDYVYAKAIDFVSNSKNTGNISCNIMPSYNMTSIYAQQKEGCYMVDGIKFMIEASKLETIDSLGVAKYLSNVGATIVYELAQEVNKTVDLSVVDQDSNPTKLGTFENITHVSLESEGLIPTLEIEVGTIISEELTSASPLMDDISVEQQNLSETVDEQSDNIDATMMATTEIYENTL